jgi:GNAT superfamily N-acetyltransferase
MKIHPLTNEYISYVIRIIADRWEISEKKASEEVARWMSDKDDSICFIGTIDNAPVAFGVFDILSGADPVLGPWNRQLWVEPQHRGSDYGHELTLARFSWARSKGYREVFLSTETAKDYHLKQGWQIIREDRKEKSIVTIMKYTL